MPRPSRTVFTLRAGSLSESDLRVRRIQGRERLSEPFDFTVDFTTASGELLELAELVGEKAALTLKQPDGTERCVHGLVWRAEMTGVAAGKPSYRIRITPRLERMKLKVCRRVFQGQSVPEIVKQVLGEHGVEHRLSLSESYRPREYCVQYREDDFSFVSRLLEDQGIYYWFDHSAGSHTLVLADSVKGCTDLPGETEIPYRVDEQKGDSAEEEHLNWLERRYLGRPEKVQVGDYDFEQPQKELRGESQVEKRRLGIEVQEWPGGFKEEGEGKRRARLRLEELRADAETWSGKGTCLRFFPGAKLEVTGHSDPSFNNKLLLMEVEHEGEQVEEAGAAEAIQQSYHNRFTAVEASVPFRPERKTPRPMALPTTAMVVGPKDEEVWVDQYGRVKVKFFWDREGKADESASCWMRAAQAWAGAGYGAQYAPRIGMEVLVKFLHHDPDQPFVAGAIYHGQSRPPIQLPHDKSQSTLRSSTSRRMGWKRAEVRGPEGRGRGLSARAEGRGDRGREGEGAEGVVSLRLCESEIRGG